MNKIANYIKQNWTKAIIFIIGGIVMLCLEKSCNKIIPDNPTIVKEVLDTIKIVHSCDFDVSQDSAINTKIKLRLENIELYNKYEREIQKITNTTSINTIITTNSFPNSKGYTIGDASPYFSVRMSSIESEYIDFDFSFLSLEILSQVYCLSLKIYRLEDSKRIFVMDENYKVNINTGNKIRIFNNLTKGKYEFVVGFVFNKDKECEYPKIYREIRVVEKPI